MEEKQVKPKRKVLGVPVAFFVIGLLVVGGASAALLTYLSNTAVIKIGLSETPLEISASENASGPWTNPLLVSLPQFAGSSIPFYTQTINKANEPVTGRIQVFVSNNNSDVACADLSSFKLDSTDFVSLCDSLSMPGFIVFDLPNATYAPGLNVAAFSATFNPALANAEYTFGVHVLP